MLGSRKQLRRLAAYMLVVLVFTLGSGVVNACLVDPGLQHAAPVATGHGHDAAQAGAHEHAAGVAGHTPQTSPGATAACAKFCADESACAPTKVQRADPVDAICLALIPMLAPAFPAVAEPGSVLRADRAMLRAKVPIPIAFLRLRL